MLPGWCCIAIAALEPGNGDSWYHMCAFRFHFWGRKVNWNQASHVRASSVPTLYACCLTKRSCHFLFVARVGLCCWFCDFAVSFLVPPDGPKNGTVKVLFFCSFTKVCMRSQKWDRQAVPFLGPCLGSFFEVFCIKVSEVPPLVSMKLCGLWRREGQLGRPFWAKPVLRRFSGPRIGSVGASYFVDDFVSCWGKRGAYRLLLEPSWRMLKVAFYVFVVWWLDCLLLKEGASALCSLGWLLEVFLAGAEFVGFRAGGRLPFESLYWILYCPLLAPLAPLDSYRSFQPRKNMNYHVFSQSRY